MASATVASMPEHGQAVAEGGQRRLAADMTLLVAAKLLHVSLVGGAGHERALARHRLCSD